ncbi:hypothetical protein B0H13DRAFT_2654988, partial [Mycena leptocephala]
QQQGGRACVLYPRGLSCDVEGSTGIFRCPQVTPCLVHARAGGVRRRLRIPLGARLTTDLDRSELEG